MPNQRSGRSRGAFSMTKFRLKTVFGVSLAAGLLLTALPCLALEGRETVTEVRTLKMLPDGKILMVESRRNPANGTVQSSVLDRLNPDGTPDPEFVRPVFSGDILEIKLLPDGRMLVSGSFSTVGGVFREKIARLNIDGSLDSTFSPSRGRTTTASAGIARS
jgi:hypothetical protein